MHKSVDSIYTLINTNLFSTSLLLCPLKKSIETANTREWVMCMMRTLIRPVRRHSTHARTQTQPVCVWCNGGVTRSRPPHEHACEIDRSNRMRERAAKTIEKTSKTNNHLRCSFARSHACTTWNWAYDARLWVSQPDAMATKGCVFVALTVAMVAVENELLHVCETKCESMGCTTRSSPTTNSNKQINCTLIVRITSKISLNSCNRSHSSNFAIRPVSWSTCVEKVDASWRRNGGVMT